MMNNINAGDRVKFQAPMSNGSIATWTATVVRVLDGIAYVRHPKAASFAFSPVKQPGLYKYEVSKLTKA